ncbi:MAG TPA: SAF domain-containing protein [Actinomycetes bacterium]|nr:SAF domain-containing protein [Actinomycetes bacterium]
MATASPPRSRHARDGQARVEAPLRLGPPGRRRQPALVVLGAALMLVTAAVAGALFLRVGNRVPVLVMSRTVQAGQVIRDADLAEVRVATDPGVQTLPAAERPRVVGQVAAATLPKGALPTRAQVTAQAVPGPGQAKVGVVLQPGQLPAEGLGPGDRVLLVAARGANTGAQGGPRAGTVLVPEARVFDQRRSETSEATVVTLVVRQEDATTVARYGAAGQVGIVVLPASGPVSVPVPAGGDAGAGQGDGGTGAGDGGTAP